MAHLGWAQFRKWTKLLHLGNRRSAYTHRSRFGGNGGRRGFLTWAVSSLDLCPLARLLLFGSQTPAWPLSSKATRVSHRPDEVQEYAFVIVLQIGQVVGEVGEVIANAGLQVLSNMTIKRGQHAAAVLI